MTFSSPGLLIALLAVPATLGFAVAINRRAARNPIAFTNLDVLATVAERPRFWRRWLPLGLMLGALASAATAVAGPQVHLTVPQENATIVLLVDVSGSMRANDIAPSRLEAAVNAMHTFVDKLPKRVNVGLVSFSSTADVLAAPTTERDTISNGLNYLAPEGPTALSAGLDQATRLIVRTLAAKGVYRESGRPLPAAIILESDGAQNRGTLTPADAARHAKAAGIRVYAVALGTPQGKLDTDYGPQSAVLPVPPDPGTVRAIARITGGKAFTARTSDRLDEVYRDLGSNIGRKVELREITSWFAAASALLLLGGVGVSRLWGAPLP